MAESLAAPPMPATVGAALRLAPFAAFDPEGLTRGGNVTHLRPWKLEALRRLDCPPEVTLDVVASTWPGRRGVSVAVLGLWRRPVAVLVLAGREGDDGAAELVLDAEGLRQAERRINGALPHRRRAQRRRHPEVTVVRAHPRDALDAEHWAEWAREVEGRHG